MTIAVALPEEVALLAKAEGGDLDRAVTATVVLYHYEHGRLSAGKAARLLGVERMEFERMRVESGVDRPFTTAELERDLAWGREQKV